MHQEVNIGLSSLFKFLKINHQSNLLLVIASPGSAPPSSSARPTAFLPSVRSRGFPFLSFPRKRAILGPNTREGGRELGEYKDCIHAGRKKNQEQQQKQQ